MRATRSSDIENIGSHTTSSMVRQLDHVTKHYDTYVIIPATVGPQASTASIASFNVVCSRNLLRRGKAVCNWCKVGKNFPSSFSTVHSALCIQHSAFSTLHSALCIRHSAFSTLHSALYIQHCHVSSPPSDPRANTFAIASPYRSGTSDTRRLGDKRLKREG